MGKNSLSIVALASGGVITNYYCTSSCRHCLYNCGPDWPKRYISQDAARQNFQAIKSMGCRSVHIGGGEPFFRPDALVEALDAAAEAGIDIDYVETNSAWFRDPESAAETLNRLKAQGLQTLLISISPFHNEHIPFARVEGVVTAAQRCGIRLFPWVEDFIQDLRVFDAARTHTLGEFEAHFGPDYLQGVLGCYWVHLGGRALKTFRPVLPKKPLNQLLSTANASCAAELSDTSHFHLDLFGNYIPGLCSGLAIAREDLGSPLSDADYPLLNCLFRKGIVGLHDLGCQQYGFAAFRETYISKCELCTEIRTFLANAADIAFKELQPLEFYTLQQ